MINHPNNTFVMAHFPCVLSRRRPFNHPYYPFLKIDLFLLTRGFRYFFLNGIRFNVKPFNCFYNHITFRCLFFSSDISISIFYAINFYVLIITFSLNLFYAWSEW